MRHTRTSSANLRRKWTQRVTDTMTIWDKNIKDILKKTPKLWADQPTHQYRIQEPNFPRSEPPPRQHTYTSL